MGIAKHRGNTKAPQINLNFCHFSAYFEPFCPVGRSLCGPAALIRSGPAGVLPHSPEMQGPKPTTQQDKPPTRTEANQEHNERKSRSEPDNKERDTPPIGKGQAAVPLITNSRQKIRKKSLGVVMKKFSEKFFGGMFRGKEKPLALSQRKGARQTNEKLRCK